MKLHMTHYHTINGGRSVPHPDTRVIEGANLEACKKQLDQLREDLKTEHKCEDINFYYTVKP